MLSNYLAQIWGISIAAVALAFLVKEKYLKKFFAGAENEEYLFFGGLVNFIIGVAMVSAHNVWVRDWQVVVTILGWAALLKGAAGLFFPETAKSLVKKMENQKWIPYALVIAVFVGLALTYYGFKS